MSIETECPGCSRRLKVEMQFAGQQARCPVCSTIYTVPGEESPPGGSAEAPEDPWRMRTPEGQLYGPATKSELDSWVSEGRVTADCELLHGDSSIWQAAEAIYPVLKTVTADTASTPPATNRYRYTTPHRGVVILVLGILGLVVPCPIFGFAAWLMGSSDLNEMRAGRMDPTGRGLTQAGTIMGMVQAMIVLLVAVIISFVVLARYAARW